MFGRKKENITVAYAPSDQFAPLALVSMTSLLENTKHNIEILILYSNLTKKSFDLFHTLNKYPHCTVSYLKIDEKIFKDFPLAHWVPVQSWYRTRIADLRKDLEKAIYLDCDTLVLGDIGELWEINMSDTSIAGVTDVWNIKYSCERLSMTSGRYFNSGVLLMNCKRWRALNTFELMKRCLIEMGDKITCSDQDVLNKIFDEDKLSLPQKFNFMETWWHNYYTEYSDIDLENYEDAKKAPVIVHFTAYKPYLCVSHHSLKDKWWYYASLSASYEHFLKEHFNEAERLLKKLYPKDSSIYAG